MGKDPAFLFYYQDFLVGCDHMTLEQVGGYIKCLCHQANRYTIRESHMASLVGSQDNFVIVREKFIKDTNGELFNERLREEMEKRSKFTQSRLNNLHKASHKAPHMDNHMEIENEIGNEVKTEKKKFDFTKFKYLENDKFRYVFEGYLESRKKIKRPATDLAKSMALEKLHKYHVEIAIKMVEQSIDKSWNGIFPLKDYVPIGARKEDIVPASKPDPKNQEAVANLTRETVANMKEVI